MNALTAVQNNAVDSGQDYSGFTLNPSEQTPRLLELTFTEQTTKQFLEQVAEWPVQALEYKSFLRFQVGKILDDLCADSLSSRRRNPRVCWNSPSPNRRPNSFSNRLPNGPCRRWSTNRFCVFG